MPDQRDWGAILLRHGYSGIKKIGEGSFGVAVLVQDQEGGKAVCKLVDISKASPKETSEARRESRLLAQVKHPYIVRYRENFADRGWLGIIMDFCDGGDVTAKVEAAARRRERLDEQKQILRWLTQCMLALKYLHDKHILHRDLKPSNIFLTKANDARLGDFGISKVMNCTAAFAKTFVGTPYYLSPEVISEKPYAWPADIWSMGCIVFQLCALRVPFDATNISSLAQKICGGKIPTVPDGFSEPLRQLCQEMMSRKASDRPTANGVIDTPLVQATVKSLLEEARAPEKEEKAKVRHEIMDQFQTFDQNGDGVIDRRELSLVLKHLDASVWTDENVDRVLEVADKNQDGHIQFDEFLLWAFGCGDQKGFVDQAQEVIREAHVAADDGDFERLGKALLAWRQAVDVGCLRVSPPEVSVRACEALSWIALSSRDLLERREDPAEGYRVVRQMRSILLAVEQLLEECSRQRVQRVAGVASRSAVRGLCFELADGTRQGLCPAGLSDHALESCGARWFRLDEGERVLEISGNAASLARAASRRPSPEPLPRRGGRNSARGNGAAPRAASPAPGAEEAKSEDILAAYLSLRTSYGRILEFGTKSCRGEAFSYTAPEGEEIEDAKFSGRTCTGIRTAPMLVNWPKAKMDEVKAAFKPAADAVWSMLLCLSFRMSPQHGKFVLLEVRRMALKDLPVLTELQDLAQRSTSKAKPPSHWDLSLMGDGSGSPSRGLALDAPVGQAVLEALDLAKLQGVLSASYTSPLLPEAGRAPADRQGFAVVPKGIELVKGTRLQNWQAWGRFVARREEIREQLAELQAAQGTEAEGDPDANVGEIVGAADPVVAAHLDSLGIHLDKQTHVTWLFHGITAAATEDIASEDFDIAKAGPEDGRLYGRGAYFSEWSGKIDKLFTPDAGEGLRCMLLCRVTLGHVLTNGELLPDVQQLVEQCTSGPYHSVLGDRSERCPGSPRDFVVYDKDQVYPEFLLWYRRVYR